MRLPVQDLNGLIRGEIVVAFTARSACTEGDEFDLEAGEPRPDSEVEPAYRRFVDAPSGQWTGVVVAVHPARLLDPEAGRARHLLTATPGDGDVVVLRVFGEQGPVLSDDAFAARRRSVEGALQ